MRGGGIDAKSCVSQLDAVRQKCACKHFRLEPMGAETPLQILQAAKIFIRIFSKILILELSRRNFTANLSPTSRKAEFKAKF